MVGRTVLVTRSTAGIGKATALDPATMDAHLAITGRDSARSEDAAGPDEVLERLSRIDVLVNNVGGYWNARHGADT